MKKIFMGVIFSLLVVGFAFAADSSFTDIKSKELNQMLGGPKDFILIDVHIPEQKHIQGTDDFNPIIQSQRIKINYLQKIRRLLSIAVHLE